MGGHSQALGGLCAIDRETAIQIFACIGRYLAGRAGDVRTLKPPLTGFRLCCGDYCVFFDFIDDSTIHVTAVRNRKDAYR